MVLEMVLKWLKDSLDLTQWTDANGLYITSGKLSQKHLWENWLIKRCDLFNYSIKPVYNMPVYCF